jgi:hypothetical protein
MKRLTIDEGIDPVQLRWEIAQACSIIGPDDHARMLCSEQVWRALISGRLNEQIAEDHWGRLEEREKAHKYRTVERLAMDCAVIASFTDGPWWVPMFPLAA